MSRKSSKNKLKHTKFHRMWSAYNKTIHFKKEQIWKDTENWDRPIFQKMEILCEPPEREILPDYKHKLYVNKNRKFHQTLYIVIEIELKSAA